MHQRHYDCNASTKSGRDIEELITVAMDCGFAIHRALGPGLLESAYEILMTAMLTKRGLRVERQKPISLCFEDIQMDDVYRADMLVEGLLIIELKSVEQLAAVHKKQLLTYLRIAGLPVGLIMNFGEAMLKDGIRRVINNQNTYIAPSIVKPNNAI